MQSAFLFACSPNADFSFQWQKNDFVRASINPDESMGNGVCPFLLLLALKAFLLEFFFFLNYAIFGSLQFDKMWE